MPPQINSRWNKAKRPVMRLPMTTDLTPYIKMNSGSSIPACPAGGDYAIANVGNTPTCTLSTLTDSPHILP